MKRRSSIEEIRGDSEEISLEIARVAIDNGYAVCLADRRLTRATRYHGLRCPGWESWWWADELTEILEKVQESGYDRVLVVGIERDSFVATWELTIGPNPRKSVSKG